MEGKGCSEGKKIGTFAGKGRLRKVVLGVYDGLVKAFCMREVQVIRAKLKLRKVKKLDTITEAVATGINSACLHEPNLKWTVLAQL